MCVARAINGVQSHALLRTDCYVTVPEITSSAHRLARDLEGEHSVVYIADREWQGNTSTMVEAKISSRVGPRIAREERRPLV